MAERDRCNMISVWQNRNDYLSTTFEVVFLSCKRLRIPTDIPTNQLTKMYIAIFKGYIAIFKCSFLEHCTLTNKAVGTIWRDLSKPPQRRQGPDPRPLWLLVGTPLVLGPELASRRAEHSHSGGCHYIFLIYCFYHLTCVIIFMASPLQLAVGPRPSQGGLFTNF